MGGCDHPDRGLAVPAFVPVPHALLTDVGVKRSHNQDACAAQPAVDAAAFAAAGHVFVVADGMGGHAVGEKASAKAVRDVPFLYLKHARDGVAGALKRALAETNAGIHAIGQENPEFRGLGTTCTALVLRPEGAWVGHVGDSRAYRIRGGAAEQLTFDHSWVWEIAKRQGVDPDDLGDFKRNVIIRSLGPDPEVEIDVEGPHPVQPGDAFLLCSDGLTGVVTGPEVGAVVAALPPDQAARLLVHLANLRGGPDNITVLIVHVPDGSAGGGAKRRAGPGPLRRALAAWGRAVPWPFTALGAGSLLALVSLGLRAAEVPGSLLLFAAAAAAVVAGLVGLVRDLRKEPADGPGPVPDEQRPLNVYKRYDCRVTADLVDRFAQQEACLVETMKAGGVAVDWAAYAALAAAAGADPAAFPARCASLLFLAEAYHKSRQRAESFRPSWTTHSP
ncbi:MAG: serine/threonine-protein phosphatase [Isosphaera sp.]|nr:serine/threonine-protein phosphatase [Isosphaera sp.]